jgi:AhpD family alkylhydroperoxidase
MEPTLSRDSILKDVRNKLGLVPEWINTIPDAGLAGFWKLMSEFYLSETTIPNKYKDLIGLAVSGATRCQYCTLFHTEGARLHGATDTEIAEASLMGGVTMLGSTYVNAMQLDYAKFRDETRRIVEYVRTQQAASAQQQGGRPVPPLA